MNNARRQNDTRRTTSTDSLFGMALAGAFMGAAFGPAASMAWDAGEMASAIHYDRTPARPPVFGL
jgi:hypothetical protein